MTIQTSITTKKKRCTNAPSGKLLSLDLAEKELSLIQVDEVVKIMERMVGLFKARCLTIPSKVSPLLQFETEMPVIVGILQKEIKEALQELADHYTNFAEKGTVEPTGEEHEPETS
ncbi:hypothetical protein ACFSND_22040 [Brevibacillus brevis]|uniref:hypothetical protein n=1 Tax=Brevibacillus brevis TaxID=1393 RepID=UPI00362D0C87